ncbi:hypothetical protein ACL7TT_07920 [Microbulbifer sp. 2304DJ12-6]|uniref:hypothetical protein n=1 Tax=Microbulbifer sp. 2304DJ12-6 TaxID=3233340 RepID=UPI0039AF9117
MSVTIWLLISNTVLFILLGVFSAIRTSDTRWPFIFGFFSILPATAILAWYGEGVGWRGSVQNSVSFLYH